MMTFLTILWNDILERIDKVSNYLHSEALNLVAGMKQLSSLHSYLNEKRNEFDRYEQITMKFLQIKSPKYKRIRTRKEFLDEGKGDEVDLDERSTFKTQVYIKIFDALIFNLSRRKEAYENLANKFEILSLILLKKTEKEMLSKAAQKLSEFYPNDIERDIENECHHFRMYVKEKDFKGIVEVYEYISKNDLKTTFPNLDIALRIFLSLPVTNCSAERGFSTLTRVKNMKRSTLTHKKLNSLMLMCCEKDIVLATDFLEIITEFANLKARKKILIQVVFVFIYNRNLY